MQTQIAGARAWCQTGVSFDDPAHGLMRLQDFGSENWTTGRCPYPTPAACGFGVYGDAIIDTQGIGNREIVTFSNTNSYERPTTHSHRDLKRVARALNNCRAGIL